MYLLIIAVLGLLVLTRFYKFDQVVSPRHFRLAWIYLILSVVIDAVGHLIMANVRLGDRATYADVTNAAIAAILAISLYSWYKAVIAATGRAPDSE